MTDIEKTLKEIDKILNSIENEPMEESITNFDKAVELSERVLRSLNECSGKLLIIKDKITKLEEEFEIDE